MFVFACQTLCLYQHCLFIDIICAIFEHLNATDYFLWSCLNAHWWYCKVLVNINGTSVNSMECVTADVQATVMQILLETVTGNCVRVQVSKAMHLFEGFIFYV